MPWSNSTLSRLESTIGAKLPTMRRCYEDSEKTLAILREIVGKLSLPAEASFVVFGSLARKEYLPGSDLDWCLLIDGRSAAGHRTSERAIKQALEESGKFKNPNATGAFGALVFSHEMLHCIGGMQDTNANLTRRLLLLLESEGIDENPVSPRERLMRGILQRYFEEEANFPGKPFFPRFFTNDVIRYWRTIAVDYAAKNQERAGAGWALRNAKLRFSRKLLYVAGLLLTFETTLFKESDLVPRHGSPQLAFFDESQPQLSSTEHCYHALKLTPLELLARACINLQLPKDPVKSLFVSYDKFLRVLADTEKRTKLSKIDFETAVTDRDFIAVRRLGHTFQAALDELFLNPETELGQLSKKYVMF